MPKITNFKITHFKKSTNIEKDIKNNNKIIKKYLPKKDIFIKLWLKQLKKLKSKEYNEFKKTNKSNKIPMQYNIMTIKKNTSLNLHIHTTIEVIYIVKGKLYEDRFNKIVPRNKIKKIKKKSDLPNGKFKTKFHKKGKFLVNGVGSVHNSYTKKEETVLLVLWGNKHHNIK